MAENEEIVALANEYRRLQRQLESKTGQLESLLEANGEAGEFPTDFLGAQNRRYSIDFQFRSPRFDNSVPPVQITAGDVQPQERSAIVESGTIFRCAYMESFLRAVGTATDPYTLLPVSVQVTLPWNDRLKSFDYFWRVRDTGTDREWVDPPQPSLFGGGGYVGPLWFPRRVVLGGGTSIYATVAPFKNEGVLGSLYFNDGAVEQYTLQISFVGHQMPDGSAL